MKVGWQNGDPQGSEKARGKDRSERRGRFDPGLTPTEQHIKNNLMRQFMRNPEGEPPSEAYKNAPCWCRGCDGKRLASTKVGLCDGCFTRSLDRLLGSEGTQADMDRFLWSEIPDTARLLK